MATSMPHADTVVLDGCAIATVDAAGAANRAGARELARRAGLG
jgi:hypothetical protein